MKRALFLPLLFLAACGKPAEPQAPATPGTPPARPVAAVRPAPRPAPAAPTMIAARSELLDFSYKWPAEGAAIPALDARFRADAQTSRQRALNGAKADKVARPADAPWITHELQKTWTVEGEAAGLLALRGEFYAFTGGAHGMSGFEAILWDRAADDDIALWSLFRDRAAAVALLTKLYCPLLDRERETKRGAPLPADRAPDWLTDCPDITKQVLIPSDPKAGRFTTVRVLIGPYEAGPYAEGSYEVAVPVTPALAAMLRPERAAVF